MFKRMLIGVDHETRGADAIALAGQLVDDNTQLTLAGVHVVSPAASKAAGDSFYLARDAGHRHAFRVVGVGVKDSPEGQNAREVAGVFGSRDDGPPGRFLHGSTSRRLARSSCSPLVILARATSARLAPGVAEEVARPAERSIA